MYWILKLSNLGKKKIAFAIFVFVQIISWFIIIYN